MSGVPRTDSRPFYPFERVELGPDTSARVGPGEDVPELTGRLFYRNRDLAAIEAEWGSLEGMERATAEKPGTTLPRLLWYGLRHDEAWADYDRLLDLGGASVFAVETQIAVARAIASAMGSNPDEAEEATRRALEAAEAEAGGLTLALPEDGESVEEDDEEGPPEAVVAG